MICAYISITAGTLISHYISLKIANIIGGCLIIFLGGKCIVESLYPKAASVGSPGPDSEQVRVDSNYSKVITHPDLADINEDKVITFKEAILLGLALALNCLAMGLGAGFTGISPYLATISIGVFSLLSISVGIMFGTKITGNRIGQYSNIISGLLLIMIGIYEIIF